MMTLRAFSVMSSKPDVSSIFVMPAKAGIRSETRKLCVVPLDSRLRGSDLVGGSDVMEARAV
ncbi:MAG: hypothetical protein AAF441_00745 [Pseudomonadota bacterium]